MENNSEKMSLDEIKDHILVRLWLNREKGTEEKDHCLALVAEETKQKATSELISDGFMQKKNGVLVFQPKGEKIAQNLVRRHRLSERLFGVIFNLSEEDMQAMACRMEHETVLTAEAVDGICSFLGHPPTCPHGRPIPPGECCKMFVDAVKPLVMPLSGGDVGENYKIVFMSPKYHSLLERLSGLGVTPGALVHLASLSPAFLIRVKETEIAIDQDIAEGIFVVQQNR